MNSLPRISLFLTITWLIPFGLHYYIWARLIRDTGIQNPARLWLTLLLVLLGTMIPVGLLLTRFIPRPIAAPLMWVVYTWLGMAFFLNALLGLTDLVKFLMLSLPSTVTGTPADPERRRFLAILSGTLVLLGNGVLSTIGLLGATAAAIQVKKVKLSLAKLPARLEGYRIVQVTDIHMGPTIGHDFLASIVERVNALEPDLVAITGDLVDGTLSQLKDHMFPLAGLRAKDGVFFVTGNHEYYIGDPEEWLAWLSSIGIRVLRNERVPIRGGFDLAGTDDISAGGGSHGQDIPKALQGRSMDRPVVLMAHQPRSFKEAAKWGVDLQLSGHTHGGQMYPFNYVVALFEPYLKGLYREGGSQLYVSCGTGHWGPPMRLGAPAEITEIELRKS